MGTTTTATSITATDTSATIGKGIKAKLSKTVEKDAELYQNTVSTCRL